MHDAIPTDSNTDHLLDAPPADSDARATPRKARRRPAACNRLEGRRWIQNSISVWSDIRKDAEELGLKHPAMFPGMLAERLIASFLRPEGRRVLDPFCGTGSTLVAAARLGCVPLGIELAPQFAEIASHRLSQYLNQGHATKLATKDSSTNTAGAPETDTGGVFLDSATRVLNLVEANSIDFCLTSPPYWNILNQKRTADFKQTRHYGNLSGDLGLIDDYDQFLDALADVFRDVHTVLRPGAYCCIVVMDLRKKNKFYPFHSDLAARLTRVGFILDDFIIWNRQAEYNNLRPLGFPAVFRINKVHEFVIVLQKPKQA